MPNMNIKETPLELGEVKRNDGKIYSQKIDDRFVKVDGLGAICMLQGERSSNEDFASLYPRSLSFEQLTPEDKKDVLISAALELEKQIEENNFSGGSCSIFSYGWIATDAEGNRTFYIINSNIGDSSSHIIIVNKKGVKTNEPLNALHNPTQGSDEEKRIKKHGLFVTHGSPVGAPPDYVISRVNAMLTVSRAYGDTWLFKNVSSCHEPTVVFKSYPLDKDDVPFLLTMCDGPKERPRDFKFKECISDERMGQIAFENQDESEKIPLAIAKEAYLNYCTDNITVILGNGMVNDGHGGSDVSSYVNKHFFSILEKKVESKCKERNLPYPCLEIVSQQPKGISKAGIGGIIGGTVAFAAGIGLFVLGIILLPVTFGGSVALMVTGGALIVVGGGVGIAGAITDGRAGGKPIIKVELSSRDIIENTGGAENFNNKDVHREQPSVDESNKTNVSEKQKTPIDDLVENSDKKQLIKK